MAGEEKRDSVFISWTPSVGRDEKSLVDRVTDHLVVAPNPFNPRTIIRYGLANPSFVSITVNNIQGKAVAQLVNRRMPAGYHVAAWSASDTPSGLYLISLRLGNYQKRLKVLLLK